MTPTTAYRTAPRGRVFVTQTEAADYEAGFGDFPGYADAKVDGSAAYRAGWLDADEAQTQADDERADAVAELECES